MVEGMVLGSYRFNRYKSDKKKLSIKTIEISLESYNEHTLDVQEAITAVHNAEIVAT